MKKELKVLFIVSVDSNNKTGLFNATHQRIKALIPKVSEYEIYNIQLVDYKRDSVKEEYFTYDGLVYNNLNINYNWKNKVFTNVGLDILVFYKMIFKLRSKIKKFNIINCHWAYPSGRFSSLLSLLFKKPFVLTLHGSDVHTLPEKKYIFRRYLLKTLASSSHNFFVSKGLMNSALNLGHIKKNNSVLYNGINTDIFNPVSLDIRNSIKADMKIEGKIVGFIGNLVEIKRANHLPNIFSYIYENYDEKVTFIIVGSGQLFEKIRKDCDEKGLGNLHLIGKVEPSEVPRFLNIMDILILPSVDEGLGQVVLEAHACGIPVLGTDTGGIPESIGNPEYLVNNDNNRFDERFALGVCNILSKEKVPNISLVNRVNEKFNIERLSVRELLICEKIVELQR